MLRLYSGRFSWMLLILGLWSVAAQADRFRHDDHRHDENFRYRYVSLDQFVPEGFNSYTPFSIDDRGRVYGTIYDDAAGVNRISVFANGVMTILQHGTDAFTNVANNRGIVGGFVLVDPETFQLQAALIHGDQVELVPPQPGEIFSQVIALNDRGTAVVESLDTSDSFTYFLYHEGQSTLLDFGSGEVSHLSINNQGKIAGTVGALFVDARAFRYDPHTVETTQFYPLPMDSLAWGQGINQHGDVLGYSFNSDGKESIGVWGRQGKFRTYFIEGIPEFPTISNRLLFNDKNLIVITGISSPTSERGNTYLVPKPGVRLNLTVLVENLPLSQDLSYIQDINEQGSMLGIRPVNFLLERIKSRGH